jgi:hypothetical protein
MRAIVLSRIAGIAIALCLVAAFSATPSNAAPANGKSDAYASKKVVKKKKKVAKRSVRYAKATYRRTAAVHTTKWHGWVVRSEPVFYHEGVAYRGGNPRGPAAWYNNYEGGFNAAVFWKLYDRNLP